MKKITTELKTIKSAIIEINERKAKTSVKSNNLICHFCKEVGHIKKYCKKNLTYLNNLNHLRKQEFSVTNSETHSRKNFQQSPFNRHFLGRKFHTSYVTQQRSQTFQRTHHRNYVRNYSQQGITNVPTQIPPAIQALLPAPPGKKWVLVNKFEKRYS